MTEADALDPVIRQVIDLNTALIDCDCSCRCSSNPRIRLRNSCKKKTVMFRFLEAARRLQLPDIIALLQGIKTLPGTSNQLATCDAIRQSIMDIINVNLETCGPSFEKWPSVRTTLGHANSGGGSTLQKDQTTKFCGVPSFPSTVANENVGANIEEKLDPRERLSLDKLIIGIATTKYGYKNPQRRVNAISKIQTDLANLGLSLGKDTILKKLDDAYERTRPHIVQD